MMSLQNHTNFNSNTRNIGGPGKLIVFEGGEGSGKTTQLRRSHTWLLHTPFGQRLLQTQKISQILVTREPGGTDLGCEIRQILLHSSTQQPIHPHTELLLYAADRAQHVEAVLRPALAEGALILCDRFTDSTVAYQGYGRGLDLTLIHQLNQIATNGLVPDLTLWLNVDPQLGLTRANHRGNADRMEQNSLDFHHQVQQGFATLAKQHPNRIIEIDASRSEDEVFATIQKVLEEKITRWFA